MNLMICFENFIQYFYKQMHIDRIINTKQFSFIFLNASITVNQYGKYLHVDEIKPPQSLWQT